MVGGFGFWVSAVASPDGSWTCKACGNVNYPFRTTCNRRNCGVEKPVEAVGGPGSEGQVRCAPQPSWWEGGRVREEGFRGRGGWDADAASRTVAVYSEDDDDVVHGCTPERRSSRRLVVRRTSSVVRRPSSSILVVLGFGFWVSMRSLCHSCSLVSLRPLPHPAHSRLEGGGWV